MIPRFQPGVNPSRLGGDADVTKIAPKTQLSQGENKGGGAQQQTATNVVVNQPGGGAGEGGAPGLNPVGFRRPWFADLFGCFDNMSICACGTFCGCLYLISSYQTFGESCCVPIFMPPCWALTTLRVFVRSEEEIDGHICNDYILSNVCFPCILCQLRREYDFVMRFRGRRIGFNQFGPMTTF